MPGYKYLAKADGKSAQELYTFAAAEIGPFLEKMQIGRYDLDHHETKLTIDLKSKFMNATLYCRDGEIELKGKLALVAIPFKGKIDAGIERWVQTKLLAKG